MSDCPICHGEKAIAAVGEKLVCNCVFQYGAPPLLPMTRRDYFAAAAMHGLVASDRKYPLIRKQNENRHFPLEELTSIDAVCYADALIAALEKKDD